MEKNMLSIHRVSKEYRLGTIGGGTLKGDLQSAIARLQGKEDPNSLIGTTKSVSKDRFLALDNISFDVKQGERIGVIGHNGAGKSTLLKLLSRVTAPTTGYIAYNGRIASMLEVGTGFHPELTGRENVYMNGAILGMKKSEISKKFDAIVEFAEMERFIDTPVKRYSSGMYVKLAFAVAAHLDSEIMIMDEVLAVGDMKFQQKCLGKMDDVSKNEGRTILYVSHNMNTIRQLCTRCIVLDHGRQMLDGSVEDGIQMYLDNTDDTMKPHWNLKDVKRPFDFHGKKLHINSFDFVDRDNCTYERNEPLVIDIEWTANESIPQIRFLFEIKSVDGTNTAAVESECVGDAEIGKSYRTRLSLDISSIAEGRYYFVVDQYTINAYGVHESFDHPSKNIFFEVVNYEPYSILWQPQYWGHSRLPKMKVVNSSEKTKMEY